MTPGAGLPAPHPGSTVEAVLALICRLPPSSHGWPAGAKAPVFVFPGAPPPVLAVVVVGAGVTLTAQPRGLLTWLCLIVPQHVSGLCMGGRRRGQVGTVGAGKGEATGKGPGAKILATGMSKVPSLWANTKCATQERGKEDTTIPH